MATITFEIDSSETAKIKAVLKALGVRKLKVKEDAYFTPALKEHIKRSEEEIQQGKGITFNSVKDLDEYITAQHV